MSQYLHGFDLIEQERLLSQARFLEPYIYTGWSFSDRKNLLEVGCGVGAQTRILLGRYPDLKISAFDLSDAQLEKARQNFLNHPELSRVEFTSKISDQNFDSTFFCWVLEHVSEPIHLLKKIYDHLLPGAKTVCIEVFNSSFQIFPKKHHITNYWKLYNELQIEMGGDPDVGIRLGEYLKSAGFKNISVKPVNYLFDGTDIEKRNSFFNYWERLLLSGAQGLQKNGRIDEKLISELKEEFNALRSATDSVFFYTCMVAYAEK